MTRLLRWTVLFLIVSSGAASAQSLVGAWQGTLNPGKELRLVFRIAAAPDGKGLTAMLHSIDQGPGGLAASSVLLQGRTVRVIVSGISATFEGTLSQDDNSIAGTFTQGGKPLPLTLVRATPETAWAIPEPPKPMAADAKAVFEVATIKPSVPDRPGKLFTVRGRQVLTVNTTVTDLVVFAYDLHARQVSGGPAWMESEKFDVTGQPEAQGIPAIPQLRAMIRQLLTDRFKLTFHRETREVPIYALVVASGGPKLARNDSNPNGLPSLLFKGLGVLPALNATMGELAGVMQSAVLDRPVVDRTGITGRYDFTLTWTPDESQFASMGVRVPPPSPDATAPGLFTAFQEQLGLRMESTRGPVEVLVIDGVEKPSEN
jgi:uncharacterized protein (TIGR03435 family)